MTHRSKTDLKPVKRTMLFFHKTVRSSLMSCQKHSTKWLVQIDSWDFRSIYRSRKGGKKDSNHFMYIWPLFPVRNYHLQRGWDHNCPIIFLDFYFILKIFIFSILEIIIQHETHSVKHVNKKRLVNKLRFLFAIHGIKPLNSITPTFQSNSHQFQQWIILDKTTKTWDLKCHDQKALLIEIEENQICF